MTSTPENNHAERRPYREWSVVDQLRAAAEKCCQCTDGHHDQAAYIYGTDQDVRVPRDMARQIADALAAAEERVREVEAAVDRVRKRHPRGDEEPGPLAPGLWCPTCGRERADNGYGGCLDRAALAGDEHADEGGDR